MPDVFSLVVLLTVLTGALSLLVYQFKTGVPPVPANAAEVADVVSLLKEAGVPEQAVIYELGCGWGTLVKAMGAAFPKARIRGIEWSPFPCWIARFRTRKMTNVTLQRGNFYEADLRDADAVTCYLMMKPMPKVARLLDQALRPGTPVVSLAFWFRGREVTAARKAAALYIWPAQGGSACFVLNRN